MVDEKNLQSRLHSAISSVLAEIDPEDSALVSRWVLSVEMLHQEGGSSCSYIASEGMATWEVIGMTEAANAMAKAQLAYAFEYEDDDDEEE